MIRTAHFRLNCKPNAPPGTDFVCLQTADCKRDFLPSGALVLRQRRSSQAIADRPSSKRCAILLELYNLSRAE